MKQRLFALKSLVVISILIGTLWIRPPMMGMEAQAGELPVPTGPILLTVNGAISNTNKGDTAQFDFAGLEGLPQFVLNTTTPWTEGVQEFTGVLLRDLLAALGSEGSAIQATALNDYFIEIPVSDGEDADVIVAYLHNGETMSVRAKGPLWIIYPDAFDIPLAAERMIWQLNRITVLP